MGTVIWVNRKVVAGVFANGINVALWRDGELGEATIAELCIHAPEIVKRALVTSEHAERWVYVYKDRIQYDCPKRHVIPDELVELISLQYK